MIERVEILRVELPPAIAGDIDAAPLRFGNAARVGWLADMVIGGSGAIDLDLEPGLARRLAKGRFGKRERQILPRQTNRIRGVAMRPT